jgi:GT2 family glycosyltransferase
MLDQRLQQVTIVMLTYNDMAGIAHRLERLLSLVEDDLFCELIILDNGSSDGTGEYLQSVQSSSKSSPKFKVILSDTNLGVAKGRHVLFAAAKGDFIASLDSDVVINGTGWFLRAKEAFSRNARTGVCGCSGYLAKLGGDRLFLTPWNYGTRVDCVSGFCQFFPKKMLETVAISEEFSPFWCEDTDFCFQAIQSGYQVRQISGNGELEHTYNSITSRCGDPRKQRHEAILALKWKDRIPLIGASRLARSVLFAEVATKNLFVGLFSAFHACIARVTWASKNAHE